MNSRHRSRLLVCVFAVLVGTCYATGRLSMQTPDRSHHVPPPEARTDINTATMDQLLRVPGMTRTWAARIIRFRPYRTKNDLIDRGVLTNEVYNRVKDYIIAHRTK